MCAPPRPAAPQLRFVGLLCQPGAEETWGLAGALDNLHLLEQRGVHHDLLEEAVAFSQREEWQGVLQSLVRGGLAGVAATSAV